MSKKIYKYIGPKILEQAFSRQGFCRVKCSYPKDYNDPYELFLTVDFNDEPEVLAFYNEVIEEIPQYPTSCFSNSPIVTPMWAHYGQNSQGFVIEFDENKILKAIENARIDDVDYKDKPSEELSNLLHRACFIGKPRYTMFLWRGVLSSAYFTKNSCWSYELERRLVVKNEDIENIGGLMILNIPIDCVSAIIAGSKAEQEYLEKCRDLSDSLNIPYFQTTIGKSSSTPYLLTKDSKSFIFDSDKIRPASHACKNCREPIIADKEMCSWCCITEYHQQNAAYRNPMRALDHAGILEQYVRSFPNITKKS
ncbi:DUF2971 domain-containing protein [Shewanella mangrovisoli]|uniref:DUF2971 domain-containing protein n=1 Tax=Shewanella mangrovisoli TaxID=2864211 RepID=UPI0035B7421B